MCVGEGGGGGEGGEGGYELKYRFYSEGQHILKLSFMQTGVGGVDSGNYPTYHFIDS